jgi:subtilisin family serine protease
VAINKRWCSGALAVLVAAGLLSVPATSAGAAPATSPDGTAPAAAGPEETAGQGTVTLITGDRVTLGPGGQVGVVRHPSREDRDDLSYTTYHQRGETYVLPTDASALVEDGVVDRELFNVSGLVESGYDDASRGDLPLRVTRSAGLRTDARNRLADAGVRVTGELRSAEAFTVRAGHASLPGFWRAIVAGDLARGRVWLDRKVQPALADSVPQVGAPAAWSAGFDGTGTTVAVLDTGVDTAHPDLAGKVVGTANFTTEDGRDTVGHGTHVASTIAGTGAASGGANRGVAPGASLLSGKVCTRTGCDFSAIIAGMEWAAAQGADVVNMSLTGGDSIGVDPLEEAVNNLTATSGTLFVVSAGNDGRQRSVGTPGTADAALSVGAVDGSDQLAAFSSRGPRIGDGALKPDITAPGVAVTAARSQHSLLTGTAYTTLDGTSMAAPHVAGAAAILAQRQPSWSPELLKSALMGSADPNPAVNSFAQGAGRLAVDEVINQRVTASPASVSLGALQQDTTPGQTVTRTVSYRNHGTAGVTLNLALATTAPAGMFSLSASAVTVPAGGQASVTLTTNIGLSVPAGIYGGRITATGGGMEVHTPFGIDRYAKLTVDHTGRSGGAPTAYSDVFFAVDGHGVYTLNSVPGTFVGWLPAGPYLIQNWTFDVGPTGPAATVLALPRLDATGAHAVHFDARLGQPISITVPDPAAELLRLDVGQQLTIPGVGFGSLAASADTPVAYTANLGGSHVVGYLAKFNAHHYVPGPGGFENAPEAYHSAWFFANQHPNGFARTAAAGSYATVDARHATHVDDEILYKIAWPHPRDEFFVAGVGSSLPIRAPFDRTEYYYTDGGIRWHTELQQWQEIPNADDLLMQTFASDVIGYTAGTNQVQRWNAPVYGPALANPTGAGNWTVREGKPARGAAAAVRGWGRARLVLQPELHAGPDHAGPRRAGALRPAVQRWAGAAGRTAGVRHVPADRHRPAGRAGRAEHPDQRPVDVQLADGQR